MRLCQRRRRVRPTIDMSFFFFLSEFRRDGRLVGGWVGKTHSCSTVDGTLGGLHGCVVGGAWWVLMRAGEAGGGGVTFSFTGGVWHGCGGNVLRDVAIDGFGEGGSGEMWVVVTERFV